MCMFNEELRGKPTMSSLHRYEEQVHISESSLLPTL